MILPFTKTNFELEKKRYLQTFNQSIISSKLMYHTRNISEWWLEFKIKTWKIRFFWWKYVTLDKKEQYYYICSFIDLSYTLDLPKNLRSDFETFFNEKSKKDLLVKECYITDWKIWSISVYEWKYSYKINHFTLWDLVDLVYNVCKKFDLLIEKEEKWINLDFDTSFENFDSDLFDQDNLEMNILDGQIKGTVLTHDTIEKSLAYKKYFKGRDFVELERESDQRENKLELDIDNKTITHIVRSYSYREDWSNDEVYTDTVFEIPTIEHLDILMSTFSKNLSKWAINNYEITVWEVIDILCRGKSFSESCKDIIQLWEGLRISCYFSEKDYKEYDEAAKKYKLDPEWLKKIKTYIDYMRR